MSGPPRDPFVEPPLPVGSEACLCRRDRGGARVRQSVTILSFCPIYRQYKVRLNSGQTDTVREDWVKELDSGASSR